eukprot:2073855-Prymnesium_polylepis.1
MRVPCLKPRVGAASIAHRSITGTHASTSRACGCTRARRLVPLAGVAARCARSGATVLVYALWHVLDHHIRHGSWKPVRRRAL